jgi:hypothetical protein
MECYRRILPTSDAATSLGQVAWFANLRWLVMASLEIAGGGWRRYPAAMATVLQMLGQ